MSFNFHYFEIRFPSLGILDEGNHLHHCVQIEKDVAANRRTSDSSDSIADATEVTQHVQVPEKG